MAGAGVRQGAGAVHPGGRRSVALRQRRHLHPRADLSPDRGRGLGEEGRGFLASTGTGAAFDIRSFTRPGSRCPGATRIVNMNRLGHALNELDGPRVMALFVANSNPAAVCPDQNAVLKGLAREDLFTVVHERFMTDTALYADVVLPAPTMLETADLYRSYGQFFVQRTRPVIPPLGESRSNWETIQTLARALGLTDDVFSLSADEHIERILSVPSPWREGLDREALEAGPRGPADPAARLAHAVGEDRDPERPSRRAAAPIQADALGSRGARPAAPAPDDAVALPPELVVHRAGGAGDEAGPADDPAFSRRRGGARARERPAGDRLQRAGRGLLPARGHRRRAVGSRRSPRACTRSRRATHAT